MRHRISTQSITLESDIARGGLTEAKQLEIEGKWFLAAEKYLAIGDRAKKRSRNYLEIAKTFTRAATFFELAGQNRDSARAYFEAASILHNNKIDCQVAGELFNRAAFNFKTVSEFFNAGDSYRRAATAFADTPKTLIQTEDNIPPVPAGAGKYTAAAYCFNAATDAFVEGDELAWARSTCWEAGVMHLKQGHGFHAYVSFRKSLRLCIRFDQTHNRDQLRSALPLTDQQRSEKVDPIKMLEEAAFAGNDAHQKMNSGIYDKTWTLIETDKQMISAFHEYYLEFMKVGNLREARNYYISERRRQRAKYLKEKNYIAASGYWLWDITCGFGDNMKRWITICFVMFLFFTTIYAFFGLIEPVNSWVDYPYFSIITMTSLGYGDIHPLGAFGKMVASLEIIFGLLMFGMLLTLLRARFISV